jgi:tellurite resistance protein TehA-like permease
MATTILNWVSSNGIIICVIVGIIMIAWTFYGFIKGNASIKDVLKPALVLLITIGLIVAATNYTSYQDTMGTVASSGISGVGTELGSAIGGSGSTSQS